ncbi:hypothetical protein [Bradyrhizobium sp. Ec3.3]|uniref:hypothetical protein n=1 Tax=Bradyrhizobium sp. Ec3.3 TaxID=189753 RepID=UPI000688AE3E|nr:hypothetical protein [Bradyrhizobium sp. Ec3.3]
MVSVVDLLQVSRFLQVYDAAIAQKGIKLSMGFDFDKYVSIARSTPTKGPPNPSFRPDRSLIKLGEGYWFAGVDENNEVAFLSTARVYDLSHSNFAEHLQSLKVFYADPKVHANRPARCTCIEPIAKKMTGKVAYHGEYWLRRDFRGRGMSRIIAKIQQTMTLAMWAPDFLCALVERWSVDKGLIPQYGYAHCEVGGMLQLAEIDFEEEYWLIWRTGEELRSLVESHDTSAPILA